MQVLCKTHCLIIVTICGKYLQNPLIYEKVMDWTQNYPVKDYVNLWPLRVTLTFEVGDRLLRMTNCFIIVNNCGKYLQNPFKDKKVIDRTQHIQSNRQCWPWMSKFDLDPGGKGVVDADDTSSYYNKYLCQVMSDSFDNWQSYGPDTKVWRTDRRMDRRTDRRTEPISISPFFSSKRRGIIIVYIERN
jgi:hypothetical protein